MASNTNPSDFADSALLIVAHGSPNGPSNHSTSRRHAESIANLELFGEVGVGFMAEKPFACDVLNSLNARKIFIVPNMATNGYVSSEKLPRELGLTGPVTERLTPKGHQRLILTKPIGTHPLMPKILSALVLDLMEKHGLESESTALIVIGHGSTKSRASFSKIQDIINDLGQFGLCDFGHHQSIHAAFLEETPSVKNWQNLTSAQNIICAPFLISDGFHANIDIPMAIGFDPKSDKFQKCLAQGMESKTVKNGRNIFYLPPIGAAPGITEIILDLVNCGK